MKTRLAVFCLFAIIVAGTSSGCTCIMINRLGVTNGKIGPVEQVYRLTDNALLFVTHTIDLQEKHRSERILIFRPSELERQFSRSNNPGQISIERCTPQQVVSTTDPKWPLATYQPQVIDSSERIWSNQTRDVHGWRLEKQIEYHSNGQVGTIYFNNREIHRTVRNPIVDSTTWPLYVPALAWDVVVCPITFPALIFRS